MFRTNYQARPEVASFECPATAVEGLRACESATALLDYLCHLLFCDHTLHTASLAPTPAVPPYSVTILEQLSEEEQYPWIDSDDRERLTSSPIQCAVPKDDTTHARRALLRRRLFPPILHLSRPAPLPLLLLRQPQFAYPLTHSLTLKHSNPALDSEAAVYESGKFAENVFKACQATRSVDPLVVGPGHHGDGTAVYEGDNIVFCEFGFWVWVWAGHGWGSYIDNIAPGEGV
ncbi:hypothetical protein P691DRAFT_790313 [Macrolepiota fuliginosa MF-IS2]|uniref:Uncharacterized protein n=1 Tax=Macrolepiota fuliginosa MF-IS2 TaxID=1400762 RepID=A0A9P5X0U6_9AGAR|nr:hypothetical protein P691DRAFT_790313 [Macrolepiota fuliginosa MF-IS2]